MVQRRAKNNTCARIQQLSPFSADCYGRIYLEGYMCICVYVHMYVYA